MQVPADCSRTTDNPRVGIQYVLCTTVQHRTVKKNQLKKEKRCFNTRIENPNYTNDQRKTMTSSMYKQSQGIESSFSRIPQSSNRLLQPTHHNLPTNVII